MKLNIRALIVATQPLQEQYVLSVVWNLSLIGRKFQKNFLSERLTSNQNRFTILNRTIVPKK
ncbi:MAG: hypothetical protein CMP11_09085 [Zetaproteobacteria bacterium]|nr:hypothetical protein [Pseudobdellovibrionaceae bacterium]